MEGKNIFNSMEYLDRHCPSCNSKIEYGITTEYDDKKETHICKGCNSVIEEEHS